jgi:hypothetical protein
VNTFLPYASFEKSAQCLDRSRLSKQRLEVLMLLRSLNGETKAWRNHPVALMWEGYIESLIEYGIACCQEWIDRGYRDSCYGEMVGHSWGYEPVKPWWLGNRNLHLSHRSNLLRKDPSHYRKYWPKLRDDLPYVWPE